MTDHDGHGKTVGHLGEAHRLVKIDQKLNMPSKGGDDAGEPPNGVQRNDVTLTGVIYDIEPDTPDSQGIKRANLPLRYVETDHGDAA